MLGPEALHSIRSLFCMYTLAYTDSGLASGETVIRRSSDPTPERRAILIQLSLPNSRSCPYRPRNAYDGRCYAFRFEILTPASRACSALRHCRAGPPLPQRLPQRSLREAAGVAQRVQRDERKAEEHLERLKGQLAARAMLEAEARDGQDSIHWDH